MQCAARPTFYKAFVENLQEAINATPEPERPRVLISTSAIGERPAMPKLQNEAWATRLASLRLWPLGHLSVH